MDGRKPVPTTTLFLILSSTIVPLFAAVLFHHRVGYGAMQTDTSATAIDGQFGSTPGASHRTPVYFLSVGGPNTIEDTAHPASVRLALVGREITQQIKPKAVVVISARWQENSSKIAVNVAEDPGLIYDFRGFPPDYYKIRYPYRGSPALAGVLIERLKQAGIPIQRV